MSQKVVEELSRMVKELLRVFGEEEREQDDFLNKNKAKPLSFAESFRPVRHAFHSVVSFLSSAKVASTRECPFNATSPSTPHLLIRSGKRPLTKEEEDGGDSETENENPVKASPSLSFFQESPVLSSRRVPNNKVSRMSLSPFFFFFFFPSPFSDSFSFFSSLFFFFSFAETVTIPALVLVFFPAP